MKNDGVHLNGSLMDRNGFYIINKNGIIKKYFLVGDTWNSFEEACYTGKAKIYVKCSLNIY